MLNSPERSSVVKTYRAGSTTQLNLEIKLDAPVAG
jgi:hypothetical protein